MNLKISLTKIPFLISKITKRIWFRAFLYALLGVATAFFAFFVKGIISDEISTKIGGPAVVNILTILASSMLAVATFSIAIMVAAFANVSRSATPRATRLLIENQRAQRAISTFIGSFLYCIVAIIALATHSYGSEGRFILFLVTIVVIVIIVVTLIKWVDQLSTLGQVGNTVAEVESATLKSIEDWVEEPYLGGQPIDMDCSVVKAAQVEVTSEKVGFVVLIDTQAIQKICEEQDMQIYFMVLAGSFVYPDRPVAKLSKSVSIECLKLIASHFVVETARTFNQDPRFGFILLAEIASRALSPAINDPGTALDVIGSATRLLKLRVDLIRKAEAHPKRIRHSKIFVPKLKADQLIAAVFAPIIRDGAGFFEIGVRIQKTLAALKAYEAEHQKPCDLYAAFAKEHANLTLKTKFEKNLIMNAVL